MAGRCSGAPCIPTCDYFANSVAATGRLRMLSAAHAAKKDNQANAELDFRIEQDS